MIWIKLYFIFLLIFFHLSDCILIDFQPNIFSIKESISHQLSLSNILPENISVWWTGFTEKLPLAKELNCSENNMQKNHFPILYNISNFIVESQSKFVNFSKSIIGGNITDLISSFCKMNPILQHLNPPLNNTFVIGTFINGIYHSVDDLIEITDNIRNMFNIEIRPFYNPSSGRWVQDFTKASYDLVLRPSDLELSKELADHLRQALQDVGPNGRVFHIAHSGGAILTYLAAKHHLTKEETDRIDVITLGGGKSITHKYFKGRIHNYYSRNDPLTLIDPRANKLIRETINTTLDRVQDAKHNTTFVFIEAMARNPILDHSMLGPTYQFALYQESLELRKRISHYLFRVNKERDIFRRLRKKSANVTGLHHFWDRYIRMYNIAARIYHEYIPTDLTEYYEDLR